MHTPLPQDTDGPETAEARSARRRLLALLIAMTAIAPLTLNIIVPAVPHLAVVLDASVDTVQLTVSLYLFVLAFSQLALGPLSDQFGRRPVVLGGLAFTALMSAAALLAESIGGLIIARSLQALGASTGLVVGRAIIRDLYHRERAAQMIASVTMAVIIAPMIAPLLGGFLDTLFGWQSIFIFLTAACVIVIAWAALALPETRVPHHPDAKPIRFLPEIRALATDRRFAGYVLCAALGTAPFFTFLGGGPHVVVTIMGRTSAEYGLWFAVNAIGYLAGNFCAWRYSAGYGIERMIWWGFLVSLAGGALSVGWNALPGAGPAALFVPQLIISLGNGLLLPNSFAGAVSVRPQAAGAASGIAGFMQMAFGAAATQLATVVLASADSALPLAVMMALIIVAGTAAYLVLVRPRMLTAD